MMLKYFNINQKNASRKLEQILKERKSIQKNKSSLIRKIIHNVRLKGDKAIINYEKKFSKIKNSSKIIKFTNKEINNISKNVDKKLKKSIDIAYSRIKYFHSKQKYNSYSYKDKYKNILSYKYSALEKVGVYVPGGTASYPSTVLMNCIPALVAGVKEIYLTTPCLGTKVNPAVIYAAKKCGVKEVYKTGGAHSIAAFAYGTKTFQKSR